MLRRPRNATVTVRKTSGLNHLNHDLTVIGLSDEATRPGVGAKPGPQGSNLTPSRLKRRARPPVHRVCSAAFGRGGGRCDSVPL
eukprot:212906-Hanusia_phi.AAC.3